MSDAKNSYKAKFNDTSEFYLEYPISDGGFRHAKIEGRKTATPIAYEVAMLLWNGSHYWKDATPYMMCYNSDFYNRDLQLMNKGAFRLTKGDNALWLWKANDNYYFLRLP